MRDNKRSIQRHNDDDDDDDDDDDLGEASLQRGDYGDALVSNLAVAVLFVSFAVCLCLCLFFCCCFFVCFVRGLFVCLNSLRILAFVKYVRMILLCVRVASLPVGRHALRRNRRRSGYDRHLDRQSPFIWLLFDRTQLVSIA
jgi:hypothetical protein